MRVTITKLAAVGLLSASQVFATGTDIKTDTFQKLHGIEAGVASHQAVLPLRAVLRSLGSYGTEVATNGRGDVDYWLRTYEDTKRNARAYGEGMRIVGENMEHGAVRATLLSLGSQLTNIGGGGRGDVDYWMARSGELRDRLRSAGRQLSDLSHAVDSQDIVSARVALYAVARVAGGIRSGGRGDVDYWMRASQLVARHSHRIGGSLSVLRSYSDGTVRVLIDSLARQFSEISGAGHGDVDYWVARAGSLRRRVQDLADVLADTASSL